MNADLFEMYRDRSELVLPELEGLGYCNSVTPRFGGPRTDGRISYEVGYIHQGSIEWLTDDGLDEAAAGSIIVDWPGDWQGGHSAIVHPCERYWVRFQFDPRDRLPGLSPATVDALQTTFDGMETRHFQASPGLRVYFEVLLNQQRRPSRFAEDISRAAFHQILLSVAVDYGLESDVDYSEPVRAAMDIYSAYATDGISVDEVARRVGLSVGYFHEVFAREVGTSPAQFHLHARIQLAKRALIDTDESITSISAMAGFSSSQYFATKFKKVVGVTPGVYRSLRMSRASEVL